MIREIALHVLGRGKEFDPSSENIIRVTVGQVRSKLATSYQDEGSKQSYGPGIGGFEPSCPALRHFRLEHGRKSFSKSSDHLFLLLLLTGTRRILCIPEPILAHSN